MQSVKSRFCIMLCDIQNIKVILIVIIMKIVFQLYDLDKTIITDNVNIMLVIFFKSFIKIFK